MGFFSRINPVNLVQQVVISAPGPAIIKKIALAPLAPLVPPPVLASITKPAFRELNTFSLSTLPHGLQSQEARKTWLGKTHNNKTGTVVGTIAATYYGGAAAGSLVSKIGSAKIQQDAMDAADSGESLQVQDAGSGAGSSARKTQNSKALVGIGLAAILAKVLIFS
jgi:hypothetical protein